jgi:hypothetical protein
MEFPLVTESWIDEDWSGLFRLHPSSDQQNATLLRFHTPEALTVTRANGAWKVVLQGSPRPLEVVLTSRELPVAEVAYLAINFDAAKGELSVLARDRSMAATETGADAVAGFIPVHSFRATLFSGATSVPFDGALDVLFRDHLLSTNDFDLLWSRQIISDPLRGDLDAEKGMETFENLPGPTNNRLTTPIIWAAGHVMVSRPTRGFAGAALPTPAAPGLRLTATNSIVFDRNAGIAAASFIVARLMYLIDGLDYISPLPMFGERGATGLWQGPEELAGEAPLFRRFAFSEMPGQDARILFASNSRAVRAFDGFGRSGAIYAGFAEERMELFAGLASFRGDSVGRAPMSVWNAAGGAIGSAGTNFTRTCSYGESLNPGPGSPALLRTSTSFVELAFADLPGSQYRGVHPIVVRALVLRYPGSAGVLPRRVTQASPGGLRTFFNESPVTVSNTAIEAIVDSSTESSVVLQGDLSDLLQPGWLASGVGGASTGGLNQIESVVVADGQTIVHFRHLWDAIPAPGDTVAFGPFEYMWIQTTHDPNSAPIRGLRVQHDPDQPGLPVCVVSWQTWAEGVDGYLVGGYGTGGAGFSSQLSEAFAGMHPNLLEALEIDAIGILPANLDSDPTPHLGNMLDEIQQTPGLEIALFGDIRYPQAEVGRAHWLRWHEGMRDEAIARRLPFVTVLESPELGSGWDLLLNGEMDDSPHPNHVGNRLIAGSILEKLRLAALPECDGDTNGDGVVNFSDLNAVLSAFGLTKPSLPGDLNHDGVVDFLDLNTVLSSFGRVCD